MNERNIDITATEQIRLQIVLELLRQGTAPDEVVNQARPLVEYVVEKQGDPA